MPRKAKSTTPPPSKESEISQPALFAGMESQSAAGVTPTKRDKRHRWMYRFWLNAHDQDDYAVAVVVAQLKAKRGFTSALKDGLRLIADLRAGRVDVLLELFPWVAERFQAAPAPSAGDDFNRLLSKIDDLQRQLSTAPVVAAPAPTRFTEPRRTADDTQLVTVTSGGGKATGKQVAANFLSSMGSFFD